MYVASKLFVIQIQSALHLFPMYLASYLCMYVALSSDSLPDSTASKFNATNYIILLSYENKFLNIL